MNDSTPALYIIAGLAYSAYGLWDTKDKINDGIEAMNMPFSRKGCEVIVIIGLSLSVVLCTAIWPALILREMAQLLTGRKP
jgi:hypothetical protein